MTAEPWSAALVEAALRDRGPLADSAFDRIYPATVRGLSAVHWTPIEIARQAIALLVDRPGMRVLDVGAGAGKLCIIGALTTTARWTGLERRTDLCTIARRAAIELGAADTTEFRRGDFFDEDWSRHDAIYLYNPLGSLVDGLRELDPIGRAITYRHEAGLLRDKLATVSAGTRVVTYHGFGAAMPPGMTQLGAYPAGNDALEVWLR